MATTRREFLRAGVLGAIGVGFGGALDSAVAAARPTKRLHPRGADDRILVVVNLFGGNDGLNTVVPLAQYDRYRELRPVLGLSRQQLVALPGYASEFGVNPGLQALLPLFRAGKMALINGVGSPTDAQGLFDHEASQQNLQTGTTYGSAPPESPTGWLGRFLDFVDAGDLPAGIDFSQAPMLLTGRRSEPLSLSALNGFGVYPSADADARLAAYSRLQQLSSNSPVQNRNRELRLQVQSLSGTLLEIAHAYQEAPDVTYPFDPLASALRDCAALIASGRGIRCLAVGYGGFDTHAAQSDAASGGPPFHQGLLTTVSNALAAFQADLAGHGVADRVVTLVFSEFGRRAAENIDAGTDHGLAAPMFVLGDPVKGGVYGDYPDLREDHLVLTGNLDVHVDARSVYATLLEKHLGADPEVILGAKFPQLTFL